VAPKTQEVKNNEVSPAQVEEDQPDNNQSAKPFIDPTDMPLPPKNKDPFADAYPPG